RARARSFRHRCTSPRSTRPRRSSCFRRARQRRRARRAADEPRPAAGPLWEVAARSGAGAAAVVARPTAARLRDLRAVVARPTAARWRDRAAVVACPTAGRSLDLRAVVAWPTAARSSDLGTAWWRDVVPGFAGRFGDVVPGFAGRFRDVV